MHLVLSDHDRLYYRHHAPAHAGAPTFVFVNALTGSTDAWEAAVAPALREAGFGTLSWNFRGQADSPFAPGLELTDAVITADLQRLLAELAPARPVLVGLSIGGLYAARAVLGGPGPRGWCCSTPCARSARASTGSTTRWRGSWPMAASGCSWTRCSRCW